MADPIIDWELIKQGILLAIQAGLEEAKDNLRVGWEEEANVITEDVLRCAIGAARGDPEQEQNMKHLMAQAKMLASEIAIKETSLVISTLQRIVQVTLAILVPAAKQMLTGILA
jgi:hypothetical protein